MIGLARRMSTQLVIYLSFRCNNFFTNRNNSFVGKNILHLTGSFGTCDGDMGFLSEFVQ